MPKQLEITPRIAAAITRSTDGSVEPSSVAVFEASAFNTLPVSKKGTLFEGATATDSTLMQMADYLNTGTNFVPLHLLHNQGGELPVGRVFSGEVMKTEMGFSELRTLFYLPLTETELIGKLDSGVIDEVSVGLKPLHMNCSECGFDYLGAEATFDNIWARTCNNDHTIGTNGVHVNLSGMDRFLELSLVSLGAAKNAKILSRAKSLLGEATYNQQLAATGVHPEATILLSTATKGPSMNFEKLVEDLTSVKASNLQKDAELTTARSTIDTLTASNTALTTEIATLKAAADTKLPEVQVQLTAAQDGLKAALGFIREEADRLAVAASLEKPADDATFEVLSASISASKTKLAAAIPVGGVALPAPTGSGVVKASATSTSFKTRK